MHFENILRRAWRKFEQFAYAMDYDPQTDLERRVAELERVQQGPGVPLPETAKTQRTSPTGGARSAG